MRALFIKRTTPLTGQVLSYDAYGNEIVVTMDQKYSDCISYVNEYQHELTIYKVGRILNRKNGRRKLFRKIYAENNDDAMDAFLKICEANDDGSRLQLLTGDWKIIAERDCNGLIKLI